MTEEWRECPGFPDYEISSLGRVKRIRADRRGLNAGLVMVLTIDPAGYIQCSMTAPSGRKKPLVHRLVCTAWHGAHPSSRHHAAHFDGDRKNNTPQNLRWATPAENEGDKLRHGTDRAGARHHAVLKPECVARGSRVGTSKLTEALVIAIRAETRPRAVIAAAYGLNKSHVSDIRSRKVWRHI